MKRKANARWQGTAKEGGGTLSTQSGVLDDTPYSFVARFGDGKGTNPEELVAAAHAGCFTMALSFMLNGAGLSRRMRSTPRRMSRWTRSTAPGRSRRVHLTTRARIPKIDAAKFAELLEQRQGQLPDLPAAQHDDHARRRARVVDAPRRLP